MVEICKNLEFRKLPDGTNALVFRVGDSNSYLFSGGTTTSSKIIMQWAIERANELGGMMTENNESLSDVAKELNKLNRILCTLAVGGMSMFLKELDEDMSEEQKALLEKTAEKLIAISKE